MALSRQTTKPILRETIEAFLAERDGKPALLERRSKVAFAPEALGLAGQGWHLSGTCTRSSGLKEVPSIVK